MGLPFIATYRVQLHREWGFRRAAEIADYLRQLGVSHLYTSPCLQAVPGSMHGYDVIDPTRASDDLGGPDAHGRLADTLGQHALGRVLDIVPNHMAIGHPGNRWWHDVLKHGPESRYARYFDILGWDDESRTPEPVVIPVLGDELEQAIQEGDLRIVASGSEWVLSYYDHQFPLKPEPFFDESEVGLLNEDPVALAALLRRQHYRLVYWRRAKSELNYRRFFDINTLIGVRVEDEEVFKATHGLVLEWVDQNMAHGLRVDHPDGLSDPQAYLERLRAAAPDTPIWVEKILEPGEELRQAWPVAGTTGYDFLNCLGGLFVDPDAEDAMSRIYQEFTGEQRSFHEIVRQSKRMVLRDILDSDVRHLARLLQHIYRHQVSHQEPGEQELADTLVEVLAGFPVYRTYVQPGQETIAPQDATWIAQAVSAARDTRPDLNETLLTLVGKVLCLQEPVGVPEAEFVRRFQQLSGPAMAKGVEDTAFYCYHRLVSLNEVGGDPDRFGVAVDDFHAYCGRTQQRWPLTMLATSTHDTKRSEDVRARINLLSEMPEVWREAVQRWSAANARHKRDGMPDPNIEYLLYQTLVGAWPIDEERMARYIEKASREAKQQTSWIDPDPAYDEALQQFVHAILADHDFTEELARFVKPLIEPGRINSLAQTLIKLTAPGVPDIYQGGELWDLSLVDPDNRRPVDYDQRRRLLTDLDGLAIEEIWQRLDEGLPKLWVITRTLRLRQQHPDAFDAYQPLHAEGQGKEHVVAYMRGHRIITIVPRLVNKLEGRWGDTHIKLPSGSWDNVLTGEEKWKGTVKLEDLLRRFPVALLLRKEKKR